MDEGSGGGIVGHERRIISISNTTSPGPPVVKIVEDTVPVWLGGYEGKIVKKSGWGGTETYLSLPVGKKRTLTIGLEELREALSREHDLSAELRREEIDKAKGTNPVTSM